MNKEKLKIIWILVLIIVCHTSLIFAQQCYIYEGHRWETGFVTYHINNFLGTAFASQEEYETAIFTAAESWNYAGAFFEFNRGDNVNWERGEEPAGVFQVGAYYEFTGPLALTDIWVITSTKEIIKTETYFNQWHFFTIDPDYSEYDIQSVILHEFGHWLRLLHEEDFGCNENVMYGISIGETKRNLTQDDKNGIGFIYGQNPVNPQPINSLSRFNNKEHSFFEYEPEVLIYSQRKAVSTKNDKENPAQSTSPYSEKILFTTPGEIKMEGAEK